MDQLFYAFSLDCTFTELSPVTLEDRVDQHCRRSDRFLFSVSKVSKLENSLPGWDTVDAEMT